MSSPRELFLIFVELATLVAGQLLLKWAVGDEEHDGDERRARGCPSVAEAWIFAWGILGMTISFFVNLGLLQKLDLSLIFPFQGLSVLDRGARSKFFPARNG